MLVLVGKPHHVFDARPVVPAAVENDDLTSGGKMRNITLNIHLAFFAVARRRQGDNSKNARADPFADGLDCPAFASRVSPLKYDNDSCSFGLHPILKPAKLDLKLAQMLLIFLALHLLG